MEMISSEKPNLPQGKGLSNILQRAYATYKLTTIRDTEVNGKLERDIFGTESVEFGFHFGKNDPTLAAVGKNAKTPAGAKVNFCDF